MVQSRDVASSPQLCCYAWHYMATTAATSNTEVDTLHDDSFTSCHPGISCGYKNCTPTTKTFTPASMTVMPATITPPPCSYTYTHTTYNDRYTRANRPYRLPTQRRPVRQTWLNISCAGKDDSHTASDIDAPVAMFKSEACVNDIASHHNSDAGNMYTTH